jgi:hypothetical protein
VSVFTSEEYIPDVSELLVYGNVVEELFRIQTIIPMRFGCFLEGFPAVQCMLEEKKCQYDTLLQELDGCVEMGIRILLPKRDLETQQEMQNIDGGQYLARRRDHYMMQKETSGYQQVLLDRCIQVFSELHCKHLTETTMKNGSTIVSVYFLISKSMTSRFRETFHRLVENEETKALMSGPWPPYNFVTSNSPNAKDEYK